MAATASQVHDETHPLMKMTVVDLKMLLACSSHIGAKNIDQKMKRYSYARREDGIHLINLKLFWTKMLLAARIIASMENPADICVISSLTCAQRAVSKLAEFIMATPIIGKFTPGTFTNHTTRTFREPRIIIVSDPIVDHQAIKEASYVGIPVIAFADTDSPLKFVDVAIPINNKQRESVALGFWMLTREILRLKGVASRYEPWNVLVDTFIYRELDEQDSGEKRLEKGETPHLQQYTDTPRRFNPADQATSYTQAGISAAEDPVSHDSVGTAVA